ncbi:MAG: TRAP transporter substrate-binding protein [Pseudomonas sp.]|nr:TRAP transporter substrate-binding protein [Pseudomonas sp.]
MSIKRLFAPLMTGTLVLMMVLPAQARDFRLGLITPPSHRWTQAAVAFADDVKEKSGGAHSIAIFPAQQLGNEAQMVQQLQAGGLDMAFLTIAEISNRVPDFGALYAPYLVEDIDHAAALLRSNTATDLLNQLPAEAGLVGIGYGMAGMRQILSRSPTKGPADLIGKKLRITPFEPLRDFYMALNSAPTPLPLPAVYDALANGQIDAIDMDFDSILIFKFYERADNLLISNHMMFPMVGVMSGRVWKDLSTDDRELLQTSMRKQLDDVITYFQHEERLQEQQLRAVNITIEEANKADFNDAIASWESIWSSKAKSLHSLRQTATDLKSQ